MPFAAEIKRGHLRLASYANDSDWWPDYANEIDLDKSCIETTRPVSTNAWNPGNSAR